MKITIAALALLLAGCSSATSTEAPATPAFDLGAVKANFTDECTDPFVVDDLFCEQVVITDMTADGEILNVPTTLNAAATDRAEVICNQLAVAHFDSSGTALGYEIIGILDQDGGNAAACTVR